MLGELIIDTHAYVYRTAEIGRQAMQHFGRPQRWAGVIDELRTIMQETGIWRSVIAPVTPTQAMREKAMSQIPPDLPRDDRAKAEAEIRESMLLRYTRNH